MPTMNPMPTDPRFKFAFVRGGSDVLVLACSGVGTQRSEMPPFEFVKAASGGGEHSVLFVSDITRSWLNAPDLQERIVEQMEALREEMSPRRVVAMGNSMGGFMALNISRVIPLDVTIAFTPQYSVDPAVVPEEKRWKAFRGKITDFKVSRVEDLPADRGQHYVFHGGEWAEYIHWSRFPVQENLRHYIFPSEDHNIARSLKKQRLLEPIINACIEGRPRRLRELIRKAGGEWRNEQAIQRCRQIHRYEETGEMI